MGKRDEWATRAHDAGYRSRAAYKLRQLDDEFGLIDAGDTVVDLGAAPGGWLQVAAKRAGASGRVVGVDRRSIEELPDAGAAVETIRGDLTEDDTVDAIAAAVDGQADLVLSDMAPNMTGDYDLDQARSVHLARIAATVADTVLAPGGDLVVKVFEGRDIDDLRADLEADYRYVATTSPPASRDASSEVYLICRDHLTAPVAEGEVCTVEITDTGDEGDAIAHIDGFTVFVEDADVGETVEVEVTAVKPRFAFARVIDR